MSDLSSSPGTGAPWYRRAGAWIGIGSGPGVLTVGGGLAAYLSLPTLLLAMPLGAIVVTALAVTQGIVSRRRREPLAMRSADTFGPGFGSGLLNLTIALTMIGFLSFYVGLGGFSLASLLGLPTWLGALAVAMTLCALHELGVGRWNLLVWLTALSALAAAIFALVMLGAKPSWQARPGFRFSDVLWGAGSVIAYAIVFATRAGDFTWDLETDCDVVKAGVALLVPLLIFLSIGAILYGAAGDWNLADVLARTRSATLGQIFLILAIVAPAMSSIHSGILALGSVTPLKRHQRISLMGAIAFILGAGRFDRWLMSFLDLIGAAIPPVLVIMLLTALLPKKPSGAGALAAWLAGAAVAVVLKMQGNLVHMIVGAGLSAAVVLIMVHLSERAPVGDSPPAQHDQSCNKTIIPGKEQ